MGEISDWRFPFGQPVQKVIQTDRTPKRVFVLGVYASAVHAHWTNAQNKTVVKALAVASEPYIFWKGDNANSLIQQISIPPELGKLSPADKQFNGPSGKALDELILEPMGLKRRNAWLCDLVPHSCMNPSQNDAIERAYVPEAKKYKLPKSSVPVVPSQLTDEKRRSEILDELYESTSNILILLGDKPIEWFLRHLDKRWKKLSDFGSENKTYGRLHTALIDGKEIEILPLAHPRQIAKLGHSSTVWDELHRDWVKNHAGKVLNF